MKKVRFKFSIRLKGDMETLTTPIVSVEPVLPEPFIIEGINVYQELGKGEWVITKRIDVKD